MTEFFHYERKVKIFEDSYKDRVEKQFNEWQNSKEVNNNTISVKDAQFSVSDTKFSIAVFYTEKVFEGNKI